MAHLCLVQRVPFYNDIAPYVSILATDAGVTINSGFRGAVAEPLLNKYGHKSQAQLYEGFVHRRTGYLPANPPGFSSHELCADGVIYGAPRGSHLAWWQQGMDVDDSETDRMIREAAKHGWQMYRPYTTGYEFHHLNFRVKPRPTPHTVARIYRLRHTLPRS